MQQHFLKLNSDKTKLFLIGSKSTLSRINNPTLTIDGTTVSPSSQACNLGVILDPTLTLEPHIRQVVKSSFYHLRNIAKIRSTLARPAAETLIHTFISCRLDYCNSLLYGISASLINRLQLINCKILVLTYKALHQMAPPYLTDLSPYQPSQSLRSTSAGLLSTPKSNLRSFGDRAFSGAAPRLWNSLPQDIRDSRGGREDEYRDLVNRFVKWCGENHLQLNVAKTREMVVDFRRNKPLPSPVSIGGTDVDMVDTYKYLGVTLDKLDWYANSETIYKKGLSRLYFLRRLRMLQMFCQSVVASTIFFVVVSWGAGIRTKDANRLNKLIKKAESVVGSQLVTVEERMLAKLLATMANPSHPLHTTLDQLRSSFSNRLIQPRCKKERYRKSFLPTAIRLYNSSASVRSTITHMD
ncbi:hypothetical protein N1851_020112 [Merluccius polli]|uniref:Alkylated DNA repair protein AlkB homologue 8 N-terminal domain-containing protein n=1 Tax=Merluccius polli TaxID=89951 RepID=A0AA47MLE9_MERPO|nr:hypothetical protein N1851_020112 [Merluccius polli]